MKHTVVSAILLGCLGAYLSAAELKESPQESPSLFSAACAEIAAMDGVKALRAGKPEEALRLLELARSYDGRNPYISFDIARAAAAAGDSERSVLESKKTIDAVLSGGPAQSSRLHKLLAAAWYNHGVQLARNGSLQEALDAFSEALSAAPADKDAAFNRLLLSRILEERRRQEKKSDEKRKQLQDISRRILGLVETQGRTLAAFWAAEPAAVPDGVSLPGQGPSPTPDLMAAAAALLLAAVQKAGGDAPVAERLTARDVSAWVAQVFSPQPAMPADKLAEAETGVRDEADGLVKDVLAFIKSLAHDDTGTGAPPNQALPPNPMAQALQQTALFLGTGSEFAAGAAENLSPAARGDGAGISKASSGMALAERSFLLALLPFIQPPQQQGADKQPSDGDKDKKDAGHERQDADTGDSQQAREEEAGQARERKDTADDKAKAAQERKISPEEARRLLEALRQDDKDALKQLMERRAAHRGEIHVEKDW
ncbi:MAG: hypothetical protein JW909_11320 [Planctomycetes bacterium]|nr:hypothetical protein [Planctomycetota bacterium]